jgi:hypothetical protein
MVSAISRAVATARAIADRCAAGTGLAAAGVRFLAGVAELVRFGAGRRGVSACAGAPAKLMRPATTTVPIQKFDFLITYIDPCGCKLLEAQGHDSKELLERKRFIVADHKTLTGVSELLVR